MKIKVSDYIADFLLKNNISTVFSVTGGGAMHLNDSFGHKEGLQVIYNHHEQACSMAAEGYTRLSGKTACVCVTSGPGGTNTVTGVMGAWLDSIPMLVISGQMKYITTIESTDVELRQLGFQEFNIIDVARSMTKYAIFIDDSKMVAYHLERALYLAEHGRPGPVWLDIPLDIQGDTIDFENVKHYDPAEDADKMPPEAADEQIETIFKAIEKAKRPVILAGNGIRRSNAQDMFIEVAEKLNIPVVHAWNAHGLLYDNHPLYAGRPGTIGTRGGNFVIQNSDLVISFGCRMHIRLISYEWKNFAKYAYKIAVDADAGELHKPTINIDYPIHADIKDVFNKLLAKEYTFTADHSDWIKWCKDINKKYPIVLDEYRNSISPINPYVFMEGLSNRLDPEDVVVASNGTACVCAFQVIKMQPGQRMFSNAGASSMGYGLPAAIGASISSGNKQKIICLEGDGSIQMNLQELQTVIHHNLNMKIFWLNNDGYHSIRQTQAGTFKGEERGYCGVNKDSGISFPSAEKIAAAYGFRFVKIDSLNDMDAKISDALRENDPVLCEVMLDKNQFFSPKLSSKVHADGTITSPSLEDMFPFISAEEMKENMIALKDD